MPQRACQKRKLAGRLKDRRSTSSLLPITCGDAVGTAIVDVHGAHCVFGE